MKIIFSLYTILIFLVSRRKRDQLKSDHKVAIEAGAKGWQSIEFKELRQSLLEYLGESRVVATVPNDKQVLEGCSHILFDPRSHDSSFWGCLASAMKYGIFCAWKGIVPIAYVTDMSVRRWRLAAFLVTANRGLLACLMDVTRIPARYLWHRRIIGPLPMPMSKRSLDSVRSISDEKEYLLSFAGSLYEPRATFIAELDRAVNQGKEQFLIVARQFGGDRVSDEQYWRAFRRANFTVTTTAQIESEDLDFGDIPQLVYRFTEATSAEACLLAQRCFGDEKYFKPGVHFVPIESPQDVVTHLAAYQIGPEDYKAIAECGAIRASSLADLSAFWLLIDIALGADGFGTQQ